MLSGSQTPSMGDEGGSEECCLALAQPEDVVHKLGRDVGFFGHDLELFLFFWNTGRPNDFSKPEVKQVELERSSQLLSQ